MAKNMIFVISGVSGAGKGTVINGVLQSERFNLARGINVTTRPREARDAAESHFQYVSKEEFQKMIQKGELIEYDYHHQNYYGTNGPILKKLLKKHNILMEADVNGALKIKRKMENVILIYITVDLVTLRKRVTRRGNETEKEINLRMKRAVMENKKGQSYDYIIENPEGHPEVAINEVLETIDKELKKREN
ncbi:MAG: guanylate kinase [Candidatus Berkelbacteria bacterium]|nr:guanylate kinase [Candidatus Berkelbacteria bacterium]